MSNLAEILTQYPRQQNQRNHARSGFIPLAEFVKVEKTVRAELRAQGGRVYYRGARPQREHPRGWWIENPTTTRRQDAVGVYIY